MKPKQTKKVKQAEHTPLPWRLYKEEIPHGDYLINPENFEGHGQIGAVWGDGDNRHAKGNADFILRAVNGHEKLVEACKLALNEFRIVAEKHHIEIDVIPIEDALLAAGEEV